MKKIFFITVALACAYLTPKAQLQRGNLMVGGTISNFNLNLNKGGVFSMRIDPKLAWFIRNNFAVGPYITFDLATAKEQGTNVDYGIGGLARYYINDPEANILRHARFFGEATAGIEGSNPAKGDNTNGLGVSFGPGWSYFLTPTIGLEALLKYKVIAGFGARTTTSNLNFGVGFQIYLPPSRIKSTIDSEKK